MAKNQQQDGILMTEKGFFYGHLLKNGKLSAGARRITEKQIMTMFMHMFSAYCAKNNTDMLLMKADEYAVIAKEVPNTENGK